MRAPIFYALTPVLLGISINSVTASSYGSLVLSALWILIAWIMRKQKGSILFSDETILFSTILGSALSVYVSMHNYNNTKGNDLPGHLRKLPARELNLCVKVKKIYSHNKYGEEKNVLYTGTIAEAPSIRGDLVGRTIFCTNGLKEISYITTGNIVEIIGVIKYNNNTHERYNSNKSYEKADYIITNVRILNIKKNEGIYRYRELFKNLLKYNNYISKECAGFLLAFVFGNKELLTPRQLKLFKSTGTMHLFAVSGLHIGIAYFCALKTLNIFLTNRLLLIPLCLATNFLYVGIVGYPVSACRAFLMIFIWQLAVLFFRKSNPLSALGWTALIVLIIMPEKMFNIGFQLSFTVVLSIIWTMTNHSNTRQFSLMHYLKLSFIISYAAFCGSLLLVLDHFHFINPISVFINGMLMAFISIIFIACLTYFIAHAIFPTSLLSHAIQYIYSFIENTMLFFNTFQFSHLSLDSDFDVPDVFHLLLVFVLLSTRNLFSRLWCKFLFLSCLPSCFLLLTLCTD